MGLGMPHPDQYNSALVMGLRPQFGLFPGAMGQTKLVSRYSEKQAWNINTCT
jgi:hypothetical protein